MTERNVEHEIEVAIDAMRVVINYLRYIDRYLEKHYMVDPDEDNQLINAIDSAIRQAYRALDILNG